MPADTQANDHWYWQINMRSSTPRELEAAARRAHAPIVSGGLVTLPDASLGFEQAMILRDPDGHASLIADQR
jgi:hypothetical protein